MLAGGGRGGGARIRRLQAARDVAGLLGDGGRRQRATPQLSAEIASELDHDGATGKSLLETDAGALETRLEKLPYVRSATVDRAFPHTLAVSVDAYSPAVFVQSGEDRASWSPRTGGCWPRRPTAPRRVPRIAIPPGAVLAVGDRPVMPTCPRRCAAARRAARIPHVGRPRQPADLAVAGRITAVVGHHIQLRLGEPVDLPLKMAVESVSCAVFRWTNAAIWRISTSRRPAARPWGCAPHRQSQLQVEG